MGDPTAMREQPLRARRALVAMLLALSFLPGCAGLYWSMKKSLREPGEHLESFPEAVFEEYECDQRELPYLQIEKNELLPPRVRAGSELNHRLVYALCPERPTGVLAGTLHTQILFRGRPIVQEVDSAFEFKPGRWTVDTFIQVPEHAELGIYALQLRFVGGAMELEHRLTFAVDRLSESAKQQARSTERSEGD